MFSSRDNQQAGPANISEQSEAEKKVPEEPQQLSPNALKLAAADCLNSWIFYLQVSKDHINCMTDMQRHLKSNLCLFPWKIIIPRT